MTQTTAEAIEQGFMAFLAEGHEGIGTVRRVGATKIVIYVENAGEFDVPAAAINSVHDKKVLLDPQKLDHELLRAVRHTHDREDPTVLG